MYNLEKTIPYKPSPAQLESLRILRERTKSSRFIQDDEEEENMAKEIKVNTDPGPKNQTVEEDIP